MKNQLREENNNIPTSIFKAYDIRGIVNKDLTPEIVYNIGQALGSENQEFHHQKNIIVGRDGRLSGKELSHALIEGLQNSGCHVVNIGLVPTPILYFATYFLEAGAGAMVTGSHNPPNYNGLKMILGGNTLALEAIQKLRQRIKDKNYLYGTGSVKTLDVIPSYLQKIINDIKLLRALKIVVDCGSGAAGEVAPCLYRAMGNEVIELYCNIDGYFPHHHPDPSQPENLKDLIQKVKEEKADIGFAFDGDGDRLGVVDSKGNIIWPDRQLMLYARDVVSRNPKATILYDVKCSRHLDPVIKSAGGNPIMYKTGHSLIKAKMKETGALLAGEMSGHVFFKERWYGFDDALYTGARLLEILAKNTKNSAEIFADLPNDISTPEIRVDMVEGTHFQFMEKLLLHTQFPLSTKIISIDGLRVEFKDGWGLIRPSNTTPSLILRFEADNTVALERIKNTFKELMLQVDPELTLSF
ncbi:phosphomannomutase/phosphoglucomutase [Candidatus Nitrosacidococcus sp. I8]|uniref:phosphomannomutase/phosphoglucomutase n=1 Tax=Candidatus Nitrosacidococcus sp. I8 TaxID=2942908 RepID=UPI002226A981|nr:phosphomannomutase/phosphoglucomutase [Candidatus Nitrosacidococcus sp. I8]CAH9019814.1 Phosphomannomutase/phosphoglucomutase [Candidatus Nitrosacidococcus sp. I8]